MGFIYKLTHKESQKAYIGQTIRPILKRFEEHQLESSKCLAIQSAIQKYGWENFDKEWYEIPDEDLNFYEEMLVALLGTLAPGGYNLKEGGGNGKMSEESKQKMSKAHIGKTLSDEHKQKLSEALVGKKCTNETKQKLSKAHRGKTLSEETKQKMSEAQTDEKNHMYGKTHTEESKQKMSEAMTGEKNPMYGKTLSDEHKKKMSDATSGEKHYASKKVYQYTIGGTYVNSYGSCGEAAQALGKTDGSSVGKCARGKQPSAYGFKWLYTEL
ncbi:GIY-YIG catalytic domain-containing endonuclease [Paramecium bursaria Chlorella virus AP110A]|nr:GIY-YIG catalytic domain-containing endonuclease [Paramecium bursaria Chlorella virus AP110A]